MPIHHRCLEKVLRRKIEPNPLGRKNVTWYNERSYELCFSSKGILYLKPHPQNHNHQIFLTMKFSNKSYIHYLIIKIRSPFVVLSLHKIWFREICKFWNKREISWLWLSKLNSWIVKLFSKYKYLLLYERFNRGLICLFWKQKWFNKEKFANFSV